MAYTVFARKYRPQTFADLVGQEHVTRTIGNAIETGRVAHAFLFTGVRGVGKTTSARILAKCLNCEKGPTPTPCNQCDQCMQITAGNDMDVLEIDGASNNSVDDVRRLQESLPFRPARDRFKVVIVDEVHMLSTGAFNAFLKTLEEPPAHVKFIFATTEIHKVPVTIRSRCQRYDFGLIPQATIVARVREILSIENIQADDAALTIVAREAAGSMRDALTVLDQVVAFSGDTLSGEQVASGLGIADRKHAFEAVGALLSGEPATCMRVVDALSLQGLDMLHFARELLSLLRDLVVLRVAGDQAANVDLTQEERARAQALASAHDSNEIQRAFAGVAQLVDEIALSGTPKLVLEMGLVRLASRPRLAPIAELMAQLQALGGGRPPTGPSTSGPGPSGGSGGRGPERFSPPTASKMSAAPTATTTTTAAAPVAPSVPAASAPQAPAPPVSAPVAPPTAPGPGPVATRPKADNHAAVSNGSAGAAPKPSNPVPSSWRAVVAKLMETQPSLGAILQHGSALTVSVERIRIGFPAKSFFGRQAAAQPARDAIAAAAESVFGKRPVVEVVLADDSAAQGATVAQQDANARDARKQEITKQAHAHPAMQAVRKVFGVSEEDYSVQVEE